MGYHLRCRSAPAVHKFAQIVRRALSVRDAEEPRPDGVGLMTEEPLKRAAPNRVRLLRWSLGGGYVLVLVLLLVKGAGVVPGVLWAVAPVVIAPGGLGVYGGWRVFREAWVLRTRGITVEGRLLRSHWYNGVEQYTYAYVDSHGVRRERTGSDGSAERAEITYDPADPRPPRSVAVRRDSSCSVRCCSCCWAALPCWPVPRSWWWGWLRWLSDRGPEGTPSGLSVFWAAARSSESTGPRSRGSFTLPHRRRAGQRHPRPRRRTALPSARRRADPRSGGGPRPGPPLPARQGTPT